MKYKNNDFYILTAAILIIDLVILLNIPVLRQIFGFIFLTILPGLLILKILKLNKIDFSERFILAVGVSISFLMFFGLLLNNLSRFVGYETPLSTIPLLISFNLAFVVLAIINYKINKESIFFLSDCGLTAPEKTFLIIPILFPALSIFGIYVMNTTDSNIILMLLLLLIPIYVSCICFFNREFTKRLYPVVIFLISTSLLLMVALRSNHVIGVDTHLEYHHFQTTLDNLHWSTFEHTTLDACLAISLLPTIYHSILNVDAEFLFKILYSLLFSISPLVIYVLSKKYVGELYAFLTSFYFMSLHNFLLTPLHARTNIAILFFALAMMVLFSTDIDPVKKRIIFIVFMASCILSHYSTTYIFFFIMIGTFMGLEMLSKKYIFKKVISLKIIILFFVLIFFWYSQVTEAAFNSGVKFVEETISTLNKFFVEEMRSSTTQAAFGKDIGQKGTPHKIEFMFTWLTFTFTGIGIITLIRRYKEMSFPELNFKKVDFIKKKFEVGYFTVALVCSGSLVAVVALPFISTGYGMDRTHLLGIVTLSVFFTIGGVILSRHLKMQAYLIILLVLIPYFLCTSGVIYNIFGYPRAIVLNSEGEQYDMYYVHDHDSYGANWLWDHNEQHQRVCADFFTGRRLISQSKITPTLIVYHWLPDPVRFEGYIYIGFSNVVNGKLVNPYRGTYNIADYHDLFLENNEIYNSGYSKIYRIYR